MVACSTYVAYRPTSRLLEQLQSGVTLCWWCRPRSPHWDCPAMCNILLRRGNPALTVTKSASHKTEVLHQLSPQEAYCPPHITIGETELKAVQQFTYMGCTISSDARLDKEVDNRLAKASSAFGRLHSRVWNNKHLNKATMISVYRAVVLTTLLYGSESWATYRSPPTTPLTFSPTVSPLHPQYPLERLHHKRWSASTSRDHQCRGHADENTATLARARLQNGGSPPTQDRPLRWTLHRAPWQRSTKEEVQRLSEIIPVYLPHRPSTVVSPCCWPRGLATCRSPVSLLLWEQPYGYPRGEAQ